MHGKTQRSLFTAIMTNFDTAVEATEDALNSEGSATQENEKRKDSLKGKVTALNSAWQELARDSINSNFVKILISIGTAIVTLIDKTNALIPTVIALGVAVAYLKRQKIKAAFTDLLTIFNPVVNGLKLLWKGLLALIAIIPSFTVQMELAKTETVSFASTLTLVAPEIKAILQAIGLLATALITVTGAMKLFESTQEDLSDSSGSGEKTIKQQNEEILTNIKANEESTKAREKEIETLEQQKKGLEETTKAYESEKETKGEGASVTQEQIDKNKTEIGTLEEKIQKLKEVQKQEAEQKVSQLQGAKYVSSGDLQSTTEKQQGFISALKNTFSPGEDMMNQIEKIIEKRKEATQSVTAYRNEIQKEVNEYQSLYNEQKLNNENISKTEVILARLRAELSHVDEVYSQNKEIAQQYYNALLEGATNLRDEDISLIKDVFQLDDEQIEKVKNGIDVTVEGYDNLIQKAQEAAETQKSLFDSDIESLSSYSDRLDMLNEAQSMYNSTGYLTADMFKKLEDNNLLQYLSLVGNSLSVNTDAFTNDSNALIQHAEQTLKDKYAQDLYAIALQVEKGNLDNLNTSTGNVTSASNRVDTSNAVNQIMNIGSAASSTTAMLQAFFDKLAGKEGTVNMEKWSQAQWNAFNTAKAEKDKELRGALAGLSKIKLGSVSSKKTGGGSSKSGKSASETYKAEVDALYAYNNALDIAKDRVDALNDALKNTDNFEEQERYIRQLIGALNDQIAKTNDLKNAQTNQINDYINQLRQQGFSIDYNASKNELYINNMQHLADFTGDSAKNVEKIIKKIQELNKDNRSLDSSIRDLTKSTKDYYDKLADLPEEKLKKFKELLKDFQQSQLDQVQNQITDLEHAMKQDPRLKALEEQIEALENQNDELDKQKELEEKLLAVEEAKEKLANQRHQKTVQIYREGIGWTWEADFQEIEDAQKDLEDAQKDLNDKIKQDQLDALNAEKNALEKSYQDRIDKLQEFLDEQNYQIDKANRNAIQTFQELQEEMAKFGLDNAEYLSQATNWLNNYNAALSSLNNTVNSLMGSTTANGTLYSSSMQDRISTALSSIMPEITSTGLTLSNVGFSKLTGDNSGQTIYIDKIELPNVKDADDFVEALKDLPRIAASNVTNRR